MVLLTGSSGFLGSKIINVFPDDKIITLNKKDSELKVDLSINIPKIQCVDIVIHSAGKAHSIPYTNEEKQEFLNVNVIGTKNLIKGLELAANLPKAFVFISSVAVYGKQAGVSIKEDTPLQAIDPYGSSKIEAENLIWKWCMDNKITCTILRLPLLVGPKPPGNLKSMIDGIKSGYYFNVAGGKAKKSMVLVEDVAKIIPVVASIGGIYNLTDGYHPSFFELSKLIAYQLNKKEPKNIPLPVAALIAKLGNSIKKVPLNSYTLNKITSELTFDDSRARKLLNWNPGSVLDQFKIY